MLTNVSADVGIPSDLQAQDIDVTFDNVSETTTVTWRNIAQAGGNLDLYAELWDAVYHVYRHDAPITPSNIDDLTPWHSVVACDENVITQSLNCRSSGNNPHPGHSATYQVGAGTSGSFYYAITTEHSDGNISAPLDMNASSLYDPVIEITTPIRSPYNVQASFNPATSETTIQWINYNSINPILPEDGPDALQINIWQTDFRVQRSNGGSLLDPSTPGVTKLATLSPTSTQYVLYVPPLTNREVFYSVTYLLPNWTAEGSDYEDIRFLSSNAMNNALLEDNTPPTDVDFVIAEFESNQNGTGYTTITWDGLFSETNEQYRIYRHGEIFTSTNDPYAQLITTVSEGADEDGDGSFNFSYNIPFNTYGNFNYCVVVVDQYGAYNSDISASSCAAVDEDSDLDWIKEPTNVNATFIGNQTTRVTWKDQIGVEGERYHIWRSSYRVQGSEFQQTPQLLTWMGSVPDGVEQFDVTLESGISTNFAHYFVTSEAVYNCQGCNGTMMYDELVQNWDGPVVEDTEVPIKARMNEVLMLGELKVVDIEWDNLQLESNETYSIYRHFGNPFDESTEFQESNYTDEGWELLEDQISEGSFSTIIRQVPVPLDSQRDVWYAIIVADSYGNINPIIVPGSNARMVTEDTQAPEISYYIADEDGVPVTDSALVDGDYTLWIETSELLNEFPLINITTSAGGSLTGGSETAMALQSLNTNNPEKGPTYFFSFAISPSTPAGDINIKINLTDMVLNTVEREITEFSLDAEAPKVTIYSPTSQNDGARYLYNDKIKVIAGAEDDVGVVSMQIRFIQNHGTNQIFTEPWRNVTGLTISEDGDWTIEMEFSSGNYLPGVHELSVKAFDAAGNEKISKVKFVTDNCVHREDGETICDYTNPVKEDAETIYPELNATDPPYMIAWITAGVSLLAVLVSLAVIASAMSGPKKKKGEEEDIGDDWMNEFIGTSSEPDMAAITGTAPAENKPESTTAVDDEDPFAVNVVQPKRRRKKAADADDEDDEEAPKRRTPKRRAPNRKRPARRKGS